MGGKKSETGPGSGALVLAGTAEGGCRHVGGIYDQPSEGDRYQMIRTYFEMLIQEEMPGAEGKMKQFASWFTHGVAGGATLRKAIYESKNRAEILCSVEEFFEARLAGCEAVSAIS
jgi:tRNA-dihydrouridine synthase